MKRKEIKDFLWSVVGSVIFGFISIFFLIITTRINGIDIAGAFAFAFANACVFCAIGAYSGKTFQITERNDNLSDSDYLYHKITTCIIMFLFSLFFCIVTKPGALKTILIIILTLFRGIDAFIDSIHCIVQRNGELHRVGKSMFIRTIIIILTFYIVDKLTLNVIYASLAILIVNILYCLFVDFSLIKGKFKITHYNKDNNKLLLKSGFFVFLYSFLSVYVLNASKYAINSFSTDEIQAIFAIIILPASFLALVSQYLIQPFLNSITNNIKNNELKKLVKSIFRISAFIILVGLLAIIICYFVGIPILELVYGVTLENQLQNLMIILLGSIFHSLVILFSAVFIAYRKTILQLILMLITAVSSLLISNILTKIYGIQGASASYTAITFIEFLLHFIGLIYIFRKKEKKITIRLMGGLGNQMFQYATLRSMMIRDNQKAVISLKGITNKTHNIFSLNHFNINKNIEIINKESLKSKLNYLLYGFYCVFLIKKKHGFNIMKKIQVILNSMGMFCVPDGYVKLSKSYVNNNVMVGYYQSLQYFNDYKDIIKKELKVIEPVMEENKKILKEIKESNSVCVHIRRGDYIGTSLQVCDEEYYLNAIDLMKKKIKSPKFYIFSDDILWVKENIKFKDKVYFVEKNNPNYEELRLMYSCKHFIISNSSFSWWAQYLTDNEKRITIAPKKWVQNANQRVDIYEDDWIKL